MGRMSEQSKTNWLVRPAGRTGLERLEAYFSGHGFDPHRHDTYAIGLTLAGVQSFSYRRAMRHSTPGMAMVLHPDELHDGHAGSEEGFRYRMVYVQPALVQEILGGAPLPFVEGGLCADPALIRAASRILRDFEGHREPIEEDDHLLDLVEALSALNGRPNLRRPLNLKAAETARELIHGSMERTVTLDELARASDCDRWSLSRDFKALFGTSPYRYLTMRRLDKVRDRLAAGHSLADASLAAGFFDQAHMTKHFRRAYGVTPASWARMLLGPDGHLLHDRTSAAPDADLA